LPCSILILEIHVKSALQATWYRPRRSLTRMPESRFPFHASGCRFGRYLQGRSYRSVLASQACASNNIIRQSLLQMWFMPSFESSCSALASMTAVDTNKIRPHSFGISSSGTTSFLQAHCRGFNALRIRCIGQISSLEQLVCDVYQNVD
jgi:hypothetical protein